MSTEPSNQLSQWINLAQPRLGARVVEASDDFFAPKERLILPEDPIFIPDRYDDHGKWMDGWESRRRRTPGHDHCIIKLGFEGVIHGFDVDTSFFTGNYPPEISIEASTSSDEIPTDWTDLVPRRPIDGNSHNFIDLEEFRPWRALKLNIFPDGGIARLRVFGQACRRWTESDYLDEHDLVSIENGGRAVACNNMHYGDVANLIAPGPSMNMGDGWETRRRRDEGHDWAILALGHSGVIRRVGVETIHFKGNYPDRCSLEGALVDPNRLKEHEDEPLEWKLLLPEQRLHPHAALHFAREICCSDPVNLVRFNIFPDGGVSRLRLYGQLFEAKV